MLVLFISIHAPPTTSGNPNDFNVPQRDDATRPNIPTLPVLQYTTYMTKVDMTNHLRGNYSTQVCPHEWWQRIFYFLWNIYMECASNFSYSHHFLVEHAILEVFNFCFTIFLFYTFYKFVFF